MTVERTLPGVATPAVGVSQIIDGAEYEVHLDVLDVFPLRELARRTRTDAHLSWLWTVLARNTSSDIMIEHALAGIREHLRGVLPVVLTPEQAEPLPALIDDALIEPPRCPRECQNYAGIRDGDDLVCAEHVTPDEFDEFERQRDH